MSDESPDAYDWDWSADEVWKSCECCGAVLYDGDDDAGWAITGDERHVCPQCKPGLVHDAAQPPEGGTER